MYPHHQDTIAKVTERFQKQDEVLGLIIGGSIAHGFAREDSDVDIMIIISEEDYQNRSKTGDILYFDKEDCTYEAGYIDGKYLSVEFLKKVAASGSEPARFAFEGAILVFSKVNGLDQLLKSITTYPVESKKERIQRFYAQFEAWRWYCDEALKHDNKYLLNLSISNLILFGGRLILAHNETLYPYHKWFLKVLQNVKHKPENMMAYIANLLETQSRDDIDAFYECITGFTPWEISEINWGAHFAMDCELTWMNDKVPIADI